MDNAQKCNAPTPSTKVPINNISCDINTIMSSPSKEKKLVYSQNCQCLSVSHTDVVGGSLLSHYLS
ncbi:hypothetical protein [Candidatus Lokiarchaeum ossiferum]